MPLPNKQSQMPNILENSPIYITFLFEDEMSIGQKILQVEGYIEAHRDGDDETLPFSVCTSCRRMRFLFRNLKFRVPVHLVDPAAAPTPGRGSKSQEETPSRKHTKFDEILTRGCGDPEVFCSEILFRNQ